MESQPQNPEFRNNPENFHPCVCLEAHLLLGQAGVSLVGLTHTSAPVPREVCLAVYIADAGLCISPRIHVKIYHHIM